MKGNSRKTGKEEYFTLPSIAKECVDTLLRLYPDSKKFLEPAAGNGSFSNYLRTKGTVDEFDITKRIDTCVEQDFLTLEPSAKYDAVVTNPPFGRASNMAIKFFNHATKFSDTIAFIVPSSWENRFFIHDKLDLNYHLAYSEELPKKSFMSPDGTPFEGEYLNCVFQIWERCEETRKKMLNYRSDDFDFIRPRNIREILAKNAYNRELKPEFSVDLEKLITIRTHGSRAGEILEDYHQNPRTAQWIVPKTPLVKEKLRQVDFSDYLTSNAYVPSLSPAEIAWCYDISH